MGLISLTWVFCHNLVKIHLGVIEILSFICSLLLLVIFRQMTTILLCQIAKNQNDLMQRLFNTKLVQFH